MERQYDTAEVSADRIIHAIGIAFGLVGGVLLLTVAAESASLAGLIATILYVMGLIATLVCSAITCRPEFRRQLVDAVHIDRLNLGPLRTTALNWLQPHEGNLIDFLFRARAFQTADL